MATSTDAHPWRWFAGGALLFFLVPLLGTDLLELQPDLYYLLYFSAAAAWFAVFVRRHAVVLHDFWRPNLGYSLVVGAVVGAGLAAMVLSQEPTDHPDGWRFAFEIIWRGVVYGAIDALTLFVFPAAVAYLLLHGNRAGAKRKLGFAGLALGLSMLVTASYHLGYSEFRNADLRSPEIGAIAASIPAVLTGNPLGSVVAHSTVHVSAVVHQREGGSTHMLPPRVTADYASRGDSDVTAVLAVLWLLGAVAAMGRASRIRNPRPHA